MLRRALVREDGSYRPAMEWLKAYLRGDTL
jgi:hypothetical protein